MSITQRMSLETLVRVCWARDLPYYQYVELSKEHYVATFSEKVYGMLCAAYTEDMEENIGVKRDGPQQPCPDLV